MAKEKLLKADWEDVLPRVHLWTHWYHRRYLRAIRAAPTPGDFVQDAVADLMTGKRTIGDDVSLVAGLCGIVRSKVSNFRAKEGIGVGRVVRHISLNQLHGHRIVHIAAMSRDDTELILERPILETHVRHLVDDDPVLAAMVVLWFNDPLLKSADLADMLELPVVEIYNAKKRLERRLAKLNAAQVES